MVGVPCDGIHGDFAQFPADVTLKVDGPVKTARLRTVLLDVLIRAD